MKISWYWQFLIIFSFRARDGFLSVMNYSPIQEFFMTKASRFRLMIMNNFSIREFFMTLKNPVMKNCLYRDFYMTKNRVSWETAKYEKVSLRTSSAKMSVGMCYLSGLRLARQQGHDFAKISMMAAARSSQHRNQGIEQGRSSYELRPVYLQRYITGFSWRGRCVSWRCPGRWPWHPPRLPPWPRPEDAW